MSLPSGAAVDFQPSENSEFDYCYNCFLAFVDEGGPRIAAYAIESATESDEIGDAARFRRNEIDVEGSVGIESKRALMRNNR